MFREVKASQLYSEDERPWLGGFSGLDGRMNPS